MANVTTEEVERQFSGVTFDQDVKDDAIEEAHRLTSQFQLMSYGMVDVASSDTIIDYNAHFDGEGVETGAMVWKTDDTHQKLLDGGEVCRGEVTSVSEHELVFSEESGSMDFSAGDSYMVESIGRRSRAELYKACSILLGRIKSDGKVAEGTERVRVGELEVEFGDMEELANSIDLNHFERKYLAVVGDY